MYQTRRPVRKPKIAPQKLAEEVALNPEPKQLDPVEGIETKKHKKRNGKHSPSSTKASHDSVETEVEQRDDSDREVSSFKTKPLMCAMLKLSVIFPSESKHM